MSPLLTLTDVQNSSTQQQNLVPFTHFATDLAARQPAQLLLHHAERLQ